MTGGVVRVRGRSATDQPLEPWDGFEVLRRYYAWLNRVARNLQKDH